MIKRFFILSLIIVTTGVSAQIPNGGFENWSTTNGTFNPDSWSSLNGSPVSGTLTTCDTASPGLPGNYYLKLTNKQDPATGFIIPGIAVCGKIDPNILNADTTTLKLMEASGFKAKSGFPYTARSKKLTGIVQYMTFAPTDNSTGYVDIQLTKWDNIQHKQITIAVAHYLLLGMEMTWAKLAVPLNYTNMVDYPDSCTIVLSVSGNSPTESDFLYVDSLAFEETVTGIEEEAAHLNFNLFPNPAQNQITINNTEVNSQLFIYDIVGTLVKQETLVQTQQHINVADLANGCYLAVIKNTTFTANQRLIIQR